MMNRLCLLVTGASRGLGRSIARICVARAASLASKQDDKKMIVDVVLVARSAEGLRETQRLVALEASNSENNNTIVNVHPVSMDLGNLSSLEESLRNDLLPVMTNIWSAANSSANDSTDPQITSHFVFFNNAGSLGPIGPCTKVSSLQDIQSTIDLNVSSALYLSATLFSHWIESHRSLSQQHSATTTVVNISSLVAVQPFATLALYSAGKAARDAYHQALALEHSDNESVRVLNYAPGPLETTDMTEEIRNAPDLSADLKPHYAKVLVEPDDSARVLADLVLQQRNNDDKEPSFKSGDHVDYYDLVPPS